MVRTYGGKTYAQGTPGVPTVRSVIEVVPVPVTLACDTSILAAGDVITTSIAEVPNAVLGGFGTGLLVGARLFDLDDEGAETDFHIFRQSVTQSTENTAHSISDADIVHWLATATFSTFEDHTVSQSSVWLASTPIPIIGDSNGSVWVVAVTQGTPTYAAAGDLVGELLIAQN